MEKYINLLEGVMIGQQNTLMEHKVNLDNLNPLLLSASHILQAFTGWSSWSGRIAFGQGSRTLLSYSLTSVATLQ
jgi:hypothetical protein